MAIHPSAVVAPDAEIDPSAEVGPGAVIGPCVSIGARTRVGPHAIVEHAALGADNLLHPGCFVGTAPQDLKYAGERTRLVMGDKNVVRECVTLNRGTAQGGGETRIGDGCLFMAYSHVAHDCRVGNGAILVNSVALAGHVEVGEHAVLGGMAGVHQYARIGRLAMIGGGAMVSQDVLPFATCQGDRAVLRGLNALGMRRAGFSRAAMSALKAAYRTLFLSGLPQAEALERLRGSAPGPELLEWIAFIEGSGKRGIMRPAVGATEAEEAAV